jgi:hypothetical protein
VFLKAFFNQLLRDLKKSWQKTAALGALLLVGLYFWVPPLVGVVFGTSSGTESPMPSPAPDSPSVVELESSFQAAPSGGAAPAHDPLDWKTAEQVFKSDPLLRSAEVAAIPNDPFQLDHDQFPPPILFEEEPKEQVPTAESQRLARLQQLEGLELKSTIVGVRRRAAFINNKLYFEGREIAWNGETFLLSAIHARKVVLTAGSEEFELQITQHPANNQVQAVSTSQSAERGTRNAEQKSPNAERSTDASVPPIGSIRPISPMNSPDETPQR